MIKKVLQFLVNCEPVRWARQHIFTRTPDLPKLVGDAIGLLGLMFLLLALKSPWYGVPTAFIETDLGDYKAEMLKSPWESRLKLLLIILLPIFALLFFILRHQIFTRTKVLGNFGTIIVVAGFAFSQLTIINTGELSKLAAIQVAHHDNLVWYGGDITTSRGQEVYGNAVDYIAKDLPLMVSSVPLPYQSQNLSSIRDYLQWTGLCPTFWCYTGKGWGLLIIAGMFMLISAISVRLVGEEKGLASEVVGWVLKRAGTVLLIWFALVFIRSQWCAYHLENAREHYENRQFHQSVASLESAGRIMPAVQWDSSVILQKGALEKELDRNSPTADLYQGFLYENSGRLQSALDRYFTVAIQSEDKQSSIEAYRAILRIAIIDLNAGNHVRCEQLLVFYQDKYPTMLKPIFLRFILAVKMNDYDLARDWQRKLYAAGSAQRLPDKRGYLASSHQYLAQLAFDSGDFDKAWQQTIYRSELDKKTGPRKDSK